MRRTIPALIALLMLAASAEAQIGRRISIRAGTPEDKALAEITAASDPAKKLELLDRFLADFGQGDMALVAYEAYIAHYACAKNYEKVFEYGDKALALDPDSFNTAFSLVRAAQEKSDTAKLFTYGERISGILQRYKASPPPEGEDAANWDRKKAMAINENQDNINFVQYALVAAAGQTADPATRAKYLESYLAAFPDSPYAANAESSLAFAYQQAQNTAKMIEVAQKALTHDANNLGMLLLLSDFWSERGEQLGKAEEYARKALGVLAQTPKPVNLTDEQWAQQKSLQQGLANSALGQIHIRAGRNAQAADAFRAAAPLLKSDAYSYARNQYRLGFALINLKRMPEARTAFTEAASVESPYKGPAQEKLKSFSPAPARKRP